MKVVNSFHGKEVSVSKLGLSARAYDRILKVSRTMQIWKHLKTYYHII